MRQRDGDGVCRVGLCRNLAQPVDARERVLHLVLVGVAHAGDRLLTSLGAYSSTSKPAWAATSMMAPVARATCSALTWFRLHATRSMATAVG